MTKKQTKTPPAPKPAKTKTARKANAETVAPVRVCDIGKNCPPMVAPAMRAVRGMFERAVNATRPLRSATPEEEAAGCSPEEMTKAARAAALREAGWHKRNAEEYWSRAAQFGTDRGAFEAFADEAKKEEALRDAALARAEKTGDVLRQLETDKANAKLADALREHTAALREGARPATGTDKPADGAKGKQGKAKPTGKHLGVSLKEAAAMLGRTPRTLERYEANPGCVPDGLRGYCRKVRESWPAFNTWLAALGMHEGTQSMLRDAAEKLGGDIRGMRVGRRP